MINSNFKKKGVFHFHSKYSFDSNTSISKIVDIIEDYKLDFVVLTDHNSVMGSLKLNEEIKRRQLNVDVPIAVEYSTECGDIIVVGPKNLISFSDINDLIIKSQSQAKYSPKNFVKNTKFQLQILEYLTIKMMQKYLYKN